MITILALLLHNKIILVITGVLYESGANTSYGALFVLKGKYRMKHIFDVDIAKIYGVNAAVLLENIGYWIKQNEANETNYFDGNYWTFNSRRAYRELFPYMSERQINTAFEKLINDGLIITGNYNKVAYDRTLWYALTQKGKCILHFDIMENDKTSNGNSQNEKPIPNINTNLNAVENTDNNIQAEFETLWKLYPRKIGKPKALKAYQKARKAGTSYETIETGIKAYKEQIKRLKTDKQYIKHGSTWFMNECWNDEYGEIDETPKYELKGGVSL